MVEGKIALVTGAAGALGREIVIALIGDGAHCIAFDNDKAGLVALAQNAPTGTVSTRLVDMSDAAAIEKACVATLSEHRRIDILINNVGVLSGNKLAATSLAEFRNIMTMNLETAFVMSQCVIPGMAEHRHGRVVNVSSFSGRSGGLLAGTAYSVSKAAMIGLTFSLAREFAASGVTVNAIAPAFVDSPMMASVMTAPDARERLLKTIPVARMCAPEEVAHAIAFLASDKSGFITGEVLDMNGGVQCD